MSRLGIYRVCSPHSHRGLWTLNFRQGRGLPRSRALLLNMESSIACELYQARQLCHICVGTHKLDTQPLHYRHSLCAHVLLVFIFRTRCHISKACLELARRLKMTWNFWYFCLHFSSAGISDMYRHSQFLKEPWLRQTISKMEICHLIEPHTHLARSRHQWCVESSSFYKYKKLLKPFKSGSSWEMVPLWGQKNSVTSLPYSEF